MERAQQRISKAIEKKVKVTRKLGAKEGSSWREMVQNQVEDYIKRKKVNKWCYYFMDHVS